MWTRRSSLGGGILLKGFIVQKLVPGGILVPVDPLLGPLTTQQLVIRQNADLDAIELFDRLTLFFFFFFEASDPGTAELVSLGFSGIGSGQRGPVPVEATTSLDPTALPEPATLPLLGAGVLALFAHARRRRQQR
jgi:hypothetical protein